jgi:hypothetical protein
MDQLAPVIAWTKKNIFWLVCGSLSVAMVVVWFLITNSINAERSKQELALKKSVSTAASIKTVTANILPKNGVLETEEETIPAHPNETSRQGMQKELGETIDSIVAAWTSRKQAQDSILVWPKCIPSDTFVNYFSQFNPPETMPDELNSAAGTQMEQMLTLYRSKIPEQMSFLCGDDVLRAYWKYDPKYLEDAVSDEDEDDGDPAGGGFGRGGFGAGGAGGAGASMLTSSAIDMNQFAVRWSDKNQDLWNQKLTIFNGYDGNQFDYPSPLQCYMLQQDLWLLEAMFRIIREVNGDSTANDLSIIKDIDHVAFGREVGGKLGELTPPDQRLADKAGSGMFGGSSNQGFPGSFNEDDGEEEYDEEGNFEPDGDFFSRSMPGGAGGTGDDDGSTSSLPYDRRYVDVNFEPLSAEVVKGVITGAELPETNLELIVAKRVPVRIALKMDERKIADFMAACANSPFAFEIQQVRWNRHTPGGDEITLGGSSGAAGAAADKRSGMGQNLGMDGFNANLIDVVPVETRTNYDVNVEFFGIVKIYNPVREDELKRAAGLEEDTDLLDDSASNAKPRNAKPTKP